MASEVRVGAQADISRSHDDQALIERWIEVEPDRPDREWVAGYDVEVWALVGATGGSEEYVGAAAHDFHVPREAVRAALAYYRRCPVQVDARLEAIQAAKAR